MPSWKGTCGVTLIINKTTGRKSWPWPSLHTTILSRLQPVSPHSLPFMDNTRGGLSNKIQPPRPPHQLHSKNGLTSSRTWKPTWNQKWSTLKQSKLNKETQPVYQPLPTKLETRLGSSANTSRQHAPRLNSSSKGWGDLGLYRKYPAMLVSWTFLPPWNATQFSTYLYLNPQQATLLLDKSNLPYLLSSSTTTSSWRLRRYLIPSLSDKL